jgi:hypothetical protein
VDVPTLPDQVLSSLRQLGLAVRLVGENLANVRDRLRMELARRQLGTVRNISERPKRKKEEEATKYTRASPDLV